MSPSKYKCVVCEQDGLRGYSTFWECEHCGEKFSTVNGVPRLYVESELGERDRSLRDFFYNGFLGKYYQHVMPFLALPVRPAYWNGWLAYGLIVAALLALLGYTVNFFFFAHRSATPLDVVVLALFVGALLFLLRHRYLFHLLLLAIPVKISLLSTRFKAQQSFPEVHAKLIAELLQKEGKLEVLDISTGTCNSLYRHGWMKLDANYTGLDLSETMLLRGLDFMAGKQVPMDFVLGDAARLPFASERFDVVLNYGALNGYTDSGRALAEMARVTKRGGLVLFFDEQLYESASWVEKIYFHRVLSSHDVIHRCPVDQIPDSLADVKVRQIYHFYYLCTSYKN
ncbi:MAG: methyltransferase domain-containing protein [Pyrinomonadaceae bacterium]